MVAYREVMDVCVVVCQKGAEDAFACAWGAEDVDQSRWRALAVGRGGAGCLWWGCHGWWCWVVVLDCIGLWLRQAGRFM